MFEPHNAKRRVLLCQVADVTPVYEEVDEKEYSRRRRDKMEDDWIVDDGGRTCCIACCI